MVQACAVLLGCSPEIVDEILWLKITYTLTSRYKEVESELNWKLSLCWAAFIVPERAVQDDRGEKIKMLTVLSSCEPCKV